MRTMKKRCTTKWIGRRKANNVVALREGEATTGKENVELRFPSWVVRVEELGGEVVQGKWGCLRVRSFNKERRRGGENLGQRTILAISRQVADRALTMSLREKGWPACGSGGLKRFLR